MFGERTKEWSPKDGMELQVVLSPKYIQTRANAMEIIQKHTYLSEEDFWILKHVTRAKKIQYDGLIITHLACLKINDHLPEEKRLIPSCVSVNQCGYDNSLVYTYANDKQGIYEVGEVSPRNCQNPYVYAMAYKRLFDRVVLMSGVGHAAVSKNVCRERETGCLRWYFIAAARASSSSFVSFSSSFPDTL